MNIDELSGKRIAVLLSGGVDSSVVVYELARLGLHPDCFYIKIGPEEEEEWDCSSEEDLEMLISRDFGVLRMVCERPATPRGRVLSALVASPMRADDLANQLGEDPLEMLRILADYEVCGVVERLPDGRYSPTQETLLSSDRIGG